MAPLNDQAEPNVATCKMRLYEHHFENVEGGKYIARPANERTLSLEDLAEDMKSIDGLSLSKDQILDVIRSLNRVKLFRLSDGYRANDGLTISYAHLSGAFNGPNDPVDGKKHVLAIKHINSKETREYSRRIKPEITDIARVSGEIYCLRDAEEADAPHNAYLPGNGVHILGEKIKVAGDSPACGVYFVPVDDPSGRMKMERVFENTAGKVIGVAPDVRFRFCRIEIVTQYTGGGVLLKEPRAVTSGFTVEAL